MNGWNWPGAAFPHVRRKQTRENIKQIGGGLPCGAGPHGQPSAMNGRWRIFFKAEIDYVR
jgi:hypothetical protein